MSAMFLALRKAIWPADCQRRAVAAVNKRNQPSRASAAAVVEISNAVKAQQVAEFVEKEIKAFNTNWYPSQWLAFVLLGAPAGENALITLSSGRNNSEAVDHLDSRAVRRRAKVEASHTVAGICINKELNL